jgi:hypothetical protein
VVRDISNHAGGYLDFASLPLCVRHAVTVTNAGAAAAMLADSVCADILELEIPAAALHSSLCAFRPFSVLTRLLVGGSVLSVFHLRETLQTLGPADLLGIPALKLNKLWVWNTLVGREEGRRESLCSIFTSELPGLRCGIKQLLTGGRVNGQVINALVRCASNSFEWCCGKHSEYGIIIWFG